MILYHASYQVISRPLANFGRKAVDFGQGFYLTRLYDQAVTWALLVSFKRNRNTPIINTFLLDDKVFQLKQYSFKSFANYDLEWLNYVVDCRQGGKLQEQYDIVEGGVANDNVIDTVELFEKGIITAEQALGQLAYKKLNHQICIHNQEILDQYVHLQSYEEL